MKRMPAFLLACVMLLSLTGSVFAADTGLWTAKIPETSNETDLFSVYTGKAPDVKESKTTAYKADGMFYCSFVDVTADGPGTGMGTFDLATGKASGLPYGFKNYIYAGAYVWEEDGGAFYGVHYEDSRFVLSRFDDMEYNDYTTVSNAPEQMLAMTTDYAHNVVYALGLSYNLYVVDVENGTFTQCSTLSGYDSSPLVMAADDAGVIYTITMAGSFCAIDVNSGLCTKVGDTGILPGYIQCMTYDYNTNELYWFYFTEEGRSGICTVDRTSGEVDVLYTFDGVEVLCAYTVPAHIDLPTESQEITGITLNSTYVSLLGGETVQLSALVKPLDKYVADRSVTWSVDDKTIAVVSESGLVRGIGNGVAIVTATTSDGNFRAECGVSVESVERRYGALNIALNTVDSGEEGWYAYRTNDSNPFTTKVDRDSGAIYAIPGVQGTMNALSWVENAFPIHMPGGSTVSFDYMVSSKPYVNGLMLSVNGEDVFFAYGEQDWTAYTYTVPYSGDYTFRWTFLRDVWGSPDTGGLDNIVYDIAESTDELSGITLSPEEIKLAPAAKFALNVAYDPVNTETLGVKYTSDDPSVASVNSAGLVVARSNGTATVTATTLDGKYSSSVKVIVSDAKEIPEMNFKKIAVDNEYDAVLGGEGSEYVKHNGTVKSAVGYQIDMSYGDGVVFSVAPGANPPSDTVIMVFDKDFNQVAFNDNDKDSGTNYSKLKFVPIEDGTYYVVVTTAAGFEYDGGEVRVIVEDYDPVHVNSISTPDALTVGQGKYMMLDVKLQPEDNDYPQVKYESSDESIVTVDEKGTIYGAALGQAEVTATTLDGNHSAKTTVTVEKYENPEPDGMVYTYLYTDMTREMPQGFMKYDPTSGEFEFLKEDSSYYYSGMYYDGTLYAYTLTNNENSYTINYVMMDPVNFTLQTVQAVSGNLIPVDMTYDYSTNTVYGTALNVDLQTNSFVTVDLNTGAVNEITRFSTVVLNIEATTEGDMYAICSDGGLYKLDKETGDLSFIISMTIVTNYISAMTYDHHNKLMYWFPLSGSDYTSYAIAFDPETGDLEIKDPTGSVEMTCGFTYYNRETEEPEMHTVEFLGMKHELIATVTVEHGKAAEAPEMTHPDGVPFGFWDSDFSNVVSDMTVQGYYMSDVNMNAEIDSGDATLILRGVVGAMTLNDEQSRLADVNANENIDAADATIVLRYIVGIGWTAK